MAHGTASRSSTPRPAGHRAGRRGLVALALTAVALAGGCRGRPAEPLRFTIPWSDGEISTYDGLGKDGTLRGTTTFTLTKVAAGWRLVDETTHDGRRSDGEVLMDPELRPQRSSRTGGGRAGELVYGPGLVVVKHPGGTGAAGERSAPIPPGVIDNEQALTIQRTLPLAAGYSVEYDNVVASGVAVPLRLTVERAESVTVPAGVFDTWRVSMGTGLLGHRAWYAKAPPHLLVKYENTQTGAVLALRSWRPMAGAALSGNPASAPVAPPRTGPPQVSVALIIVTVAVQLPLMIVLPLLLGRTLRRRLGVSWAVFGAGALTFVASQVVHLPLNWAVGLLGAPRGLGLLPLPLLAVAAGLSAGLCEELARYVTLRLVLKRARSYAAALQFGMGHGGVEAIVIGVLVGITLVNMLVLRTLPPARLGLTGEQAAQVAIAAEAYWRTPWYVAITGGLERVFALCAHVAMSVLVMRAVVRRQLVWLAAAVLAHAFLDGVAVLASRTLGVLATEGIVAVLAVGFLALTYALREAPPAAAPAPPPGAAPPPTGT